MLAVLLSSMTTAAMLTISPCCYRCAGRRHARHAALAVPATATLAVPLWPSSPECCPTVARAAAMRTISPCCCRCAGRRHARHAALAVPATATLAVPLWPGSPKCLPTVAHTAEII
ncbi:hypothetical protein PR002_g30856 [Phytophthora rubi]|uniref:RxLR effector protein n=1 Tax=Phytophthora rubi TaxID=129364 RepID=A0A6A3GN67_9STRA|nr:hypothetical protein PR002_g30856 [Phytophthora rubi]